MQKNVSYHESAIQYNEELAKEAEKQERLVEHPEVKKWCRSVARQHRFHEKRHRSALAKMLKVQAAAEAGELTETEIEADKNAAEARAQIDGPNHDDPQVEAEKIEEDDVNYHSSETGQFVSEEYAEENPATTVAVTEKEG